MAQLIRTADVARKLGLSVERFYRKRAELTAAGFPPPCPPFTNRWSAAAVDTWIDRQPSAMPAGADRVVATVPAEDLPADDDTARWSQILSERARRAANL